MACSAISHMSNSAPARLWIAFSFSESARRPARAGGSSTAQVWGPRTQTVRAAAANTGGGRGRKPRAGPRRAGKRAGAGRQPGALLGHVARGDQVAFEAVYDRTAGQVPGVIGA